MKYKNAKIILEGFWGVGKTTYAKNLNNKEWYFIVEPNHNNFNSFKNLENATSFYILCHLTNMKRMKFSEKPCVLERSIISSFAYNYAIYNPVWRVILSYMKDNGDLFKDVKIYCFFCDLPRFEKIIKKYRNNKIIPRSISSAVFYKRFVNAFRIFQKFYPNDTSIIMLNDGKFVSDILN